MTIKGIRPEFDLHLGLTIHSQMRRNHNTGFKTRKIREWSVVFLYVLLFFYCDQCFSIKPGPSRLGQMLSLLLQNLSEISKSYSWISMIG